MIIASDFILFFAVLVSLPPSAYMVCKWGAAGVYRAKDRHDKKQQSMKKYEQKQ